MNKEPEAIPPVAISDSIGTAYDDAFFTDRTKSCWASEWDSTSSGKLVQRILTLTSSLKIESFKRGGSTVEGGCEW